MPPTYDQPAELILPDRPLTERSFLGSVLFPRVGRETITFFTAQNINPLPHRDEEVQLKALDETIKIRIETASLTGEGTRVLAKNSLAAKKTPGI